MTGQHDFLILPGQVADGSHNFFTHSHIGLAEFINEVQIIFVVEPVEDAFGHDVADGVYVREFFLGCVLEGVHVAVALCKDTGGFRANVADTERKDDVA